MARNTVSEWSTDPDQNTDIAGINIAEYCPPSSINNAIRSMMAQLVAVTTGVLLRSGGALSGALTGLGFGSTIKDEANVERPLGYRGIPANPRTTAYTLVVADAGKCIDITTGGVTVPTNASAAFLIGDTVQVFNNSTTAQAITPASGVTLRLAAGGTGTRTMVGYAWVTLRKFGTNDWVISGAGLS